MSTPSPAEPKRGKSKKEPTLTANRMLLIKMRYAFWVFLLGLAGVTLLMLCGSEPPKQLQTAGMQAFTAIASGAVGALYGLMNSRTSLSDQGARADK
jgi:drug/metabolite transporter (DMT)-like permease